jgi:hypothetical protein
MADDYTCAACGGRLVNAPNHTSPSLGVVMACADCGRFFGRNASTGVIVEALDVRDAY